MKWFVHESSQISLHILWEYCDNLIDIEHFRRTFINLCLNEIETNDIIKHLINRFNAVCNISVKCIAAIWKKVGLGLNVHLRIEIQRNSVKLPTVCTAFIGYDKASGRRGGGFKAKSEHHTGECNFYLRIIFILILSKT